MKRIALTLALVLSSVSSASAAPVTGTYTTGGATTGTGPWTMTSTDSTFSILRFVFNTPVTFSDLTSLSVAYDAQLGGIGGGAPRIALVVDTNNDLIADGSFLIHWGPAGSFADPTLGLGNTGNLLALTDVGRYDLSGIGGSAYTDRTAALALAGGFDILRASIILDSFGGNDRRFVIDGVSVSAVDVAAVPEPASLALWSLAGIVGLRGAWRRRKARGV